MKPKLNITLIICLFTCLIHLRSFSQAWGDVPPATVKENVIKIDADKIKPFYRGYAVIKKGQLEAVIDKTGKFVLPFGKYIFPSDRNYYYSNPEDFHQNDRFVFIDEKSRDCGFISLSGKVYRLPGVKGFKTMFDEDGRCIGVTDKNIVLIDTTGKVAILRPLAANNDYYLINADLKLPQPSNNTEGYLTGVNEFGFKNYITDKFVIKPRFGHGRSFSDGLAAVMVKDEFGKPKWGFIDTTGKIAIPVQYSTPPKDFSYRMALVYPADRKDFFAAFIDKKGNVRIQLKTAQYAQTNGLFPTVSSFYGQGFAYLTGKNNLQEDNILAPDGSVTPLSKFIYQHGGPEVKKGSVLKVIGVERGRFFIQADGDSRATLEFDSWSGNIRFIPCPVNQMVPEAFNYDEVSGLRHFQIRNRQTGKTIEGYINDENEFVLVKDDSSQW